MKTIFKDDRPIKRIIWPMEEGSIAVGNTNIEKIVSYQENGQVAPVTWFAIYRNGKIDQRVNAAFVESILYS